MPVALIVKEMVKSQLRWFEHIQVRQLDAPIRKVVQMLWNSPKREKGGHKRTFNEIM